MTPKPPPYYTMTSNWWCPPELKPLRWVFKHKPGHHVPLNVPCPQCKAKKGKPCLMPSGVTKATPHLARWVKASR